MDIFCLDMLVNLNLKRGPWFFVWATIIENNISIRGTHDVFEWFLTCSNRGNHRRIQVFLLWRFRWNLMGVSFCPMILFGWMWLCRVCHLNINEVDNSMILSGGGYVLCWVCHLDIFRRSKDRKDSLYMGQVSGSLAFTLMQLFCWQSNNCFLEIVYISLYSICQLLCWYANKSNPTIALLKDSLYAILAIPVLQSALIGMTSTYQILSL